MLTIRLNQNGTLRAFQTNKAITLLKRADKAYAEIMHLITETERPGDTLFESGEATVLTERAGMPPPLAALRLSSPVDKGLTSPLDDARVVCLYEGDTAKVIDCGAILFEWPEKSKGTPGGVA